VVVRLTCVSCKREVVLPASGVRLCTANGRPTISYRCPACRDDCITDCSATHLAEFGKAGISPRVFTLPPPTLDGMEPQGPPISETDVGDLLIDLHTMADPLAELTR
jgi:hypothetical protein